MSPEPQPDPAELEAAEAQMTAAYRAAVRDLVLAALPAALASLSVITLRRQRTAIRHTLLELQAFSSGHTAPTSDTAATAADRETAFLKVSAALPDTFYLIGNGGSHATIRDQVYGRDWLGVVDIDALAANPDALAELVATLKITAEDQGLDGG